MQPCSDYWDCHDTFIIITLFNWPSHSLKNKIQYLFKYMAEQQQSWAATRRGAATQKLAAAQRTNHQPPGQATVTRPTPRPSPATQLSPGYTSSSHQAKQQMSLLTSGHQLCFLGSYWTWLLAFCYQPCLFTSLNVVIHWNFSVHYVTNYSIMFCTFVWLYWYPNESGNPPLQAMLF